MSRASGGGGESCSSSKQSIASASAAATSPPGSRCASARRRNAARPLGPPRSCSVCIGTSTSEHLRLSANSPRVGDHSLDGECPGAVAERSQQLRIDVERDQLGAARGEVERHAAGSRADVEHAATGLGGELPPQREIVAIRTALQVVPERVEVHVRARSPRLTRRL